MAIQEDAKLVRLLSFRITPLLALGPCLFWASKCHKRASKYGKSELRGVKKGEAGLSGGKTADWVLITRLPDLDRNGAAPLNWGPLWPKYKNRNFAQRRFWSCFRFRFISFLCLRQRRFGQVPRRLA